MNTTHKVEFFIGGNVNGKPTHSHEDMEKACAQYLTASGIESFTIYPTIGYWNGERELSVHVIAYINVGQTSKKVATALADLLQQEEVLTLVDGIPSN